MTFRHVKGLLLMSAVLMFLTIVITFNARVTGIYAGLVAVASSISRQLAPPVFPVWVSSSLVRVGEADAPGTASSVTLSSARGETVDTQVIVQAPSGGL